MTGVDIENVTYILRSLGLSATNLQTGMIKQILSDVASKIQQSPSDFDDQKLIELATALVPYICDPIFCTLWLALLHKLSNIPENEKLNALYEEINKKQAELFPESSLPVNVLHCLWLSHLPSLEFCVLLVVKKNSETILFPESMLSIFSNCHITEIARKEPLIYQMIYVILHSITVQRNYQENIIEVLALFSNSVRLSSLNQQISVQRPQYTAILKSMFSFSLESSSPKVVGKIIVKLHEAYLFCRNEHMKSYGSEYNSDIVYEEFWSLTVEYRQWILTALNSIYQCDSQDVQACLWLLLMHKRIKPNISGFTTVQDTFLKCINYLRNIFDTSLVSREYIQVFNNASGDWLRAEYFQCQESALQLILQILVVFFFHSSSGFKFVQEFITNQHNTIIMMEDFIIQLIRFYQLNSFNSSLWDSDRKFLFRTFINNLICWSQTNPKYRHFQKELSHLLDG